MLDHSFNTYSGDDVHDLGRLINERIRQRTSPRDGKLSVFCECADVDCAQQIELSSAEYLSIRQMDSCFLVSDGHELPERETIVSRESSWVVVEKRENLNSSSVGATVK